MLFLDDRRTEIKAVHHELFMKKKRLRKLAGKCMCESELDPRKAMTTLPQIIALAAEVLKDERTLDEMIDKYNAR